jgi:hypothetical protein
MRWLDVEASDFEAMGQCALQAKLMALGARINACLHVVG